jgi:hypothetical protein
MGLQAIATVTLPVEPAAWEIELALAPACEEVRGTRRDRLWFVALAGIQATVTLTREDGVALVVTVPSREDRALEACDGLARALADALGGRTTGAERVS